MAVYPIPRQAEENWGDWRQMIMNAMKIAMPGTRPQMPQGAPPTPPSLPDLIAQLTMEQTPQAAMGSGIMGMGSMPLLTSQGRKWINNAKNIYGITDNPNEAGFILPSGELLNLNRGTNRIEHRAIGSPDIMPNFQEYQGKILDNWDKLNKFMYESDSIRMAAGRNSYGNNIYLNFMKKPNQSQLGTLKEILPYYSNAYIETSKPNALITPEDKLARIWKGGWLKESVIENPTIGALTQLLKKWLK